MSPLDRRELQRLRYWQGQMLRSQDFRDQIAIEAQLRWWHNRALHNAFGIAGGLAVELLETSGTCLALVHRGLAYDGFGRELVHPRTESIAVPLAEEGMVLLARYKDSGSFPRRDERSGPCVAGIDGACKEQVELIWKPAVRLSIQDGVPLAHVSSAGLESLPASVPSEVLKGKLYYDAARKTLFLLGVMSNTEGHELLKLAPDPSFQAAVQRLFQLSQSSPSRPLSRPLARPHIASGATIAGHTGWEPWTVPVAFGRGSNVERRPVQVGFQVKIDTSAAGFTQVPAYFARLQGQLWQLNPLETLFGVHWDHIEEVSIKSFSFRFVIFPQKLLQDLIVGSLPNQFLALQQEALQFLQNNLFFVSWLGIQPAPGDHQASDADEVTSGHS